jgi:hypothetical protein
MKAVEFPEQNSTLAAPSGMVGDVMPLPIMILPSPDNPQLLISKWKLDDDDLEMIQENGGHIYLAIHAPFHPPVSLATACYVMPTDELLAENASIAEMSETEFDYAMPDDERAE